MVKVINLLPTEKAKRSAKQHGMCDSKKERKNKLMKYGEKISEVTHFKVKLPTQIY